MGCRLHLPRARDPPRAQHRARPVGKLPLAANGRLRRRMPHRPRFVRLPPGRRRLTRQPASARSRLGAHRKRPLLLFRHAAGSEFHLSSRSPRNGSSGKVVAARSPHRFVHLRMPRRPRCFLLNDGRAEPEEHGPLRPHLRRPRRRGTGIPYWLGKKIDGPWASSNTATPSCPMARTAHHTSALTTTAVESEDMVTSLSAIEP